MQNAGRKDSAVAAKRLDEVVDSSTLACPLNGRFGVPVKEETGKIGVAAFVCVGKALAFTRGRMHPPVVHHRAALVVASLAVLGIPDMRLDGQEEFRFRSGVELVNVTATVTDRSGRFVAGLREADFVVYEDDRPVDITHFSAERVPVSLGIVLDTSGSMAGEKIVTARTAIERFLDQLLSPDDEVFLYGFANEVRLLQDWTIDRAAVSASLRGVRANGGTAMYDALLEAVPRANNGRHLKKAVVLISDGDDTNSRTGVRDVRAVIRETEVLVYAIGIDGQDEPRTRWQSPTYPPGPIPFPVPGRRRPGGLWPSLPQLPPVIGRFRGGSRLNVSALRNITDESGGRTEVVRKVGDLNPATASIADELSRQYHLGYASPGHRDGQWHPIRVEPRDRTLRVRARRGYVAAS